MNKRVELPLTEALYSTYHNQGPGMAITYNNPTIRNWYLNQVMNLACNRKFLNGFTTPEITVAGSSWTANPHLDRVWMSLQFAKGYINPLIREMVDNGYYVAFDNVDDYYVKGKSWYMERHFSHDGLICGYDQHDKTYCIYAYDTNWIYQKFWTPQKSFNRGREAMVKKGIYGNIYAIKPSTEEVAFAPKLALKNILDYLDSDMEKYPENGEGNVRGIVVHSYIAKYLEKLSDESIPYERMDRRVFRLIWEHKKVMLERVFQIEHSLGMDHEISDQYKPLVTEADAMRMLYASHHMKRRDAVLPVIKKKLLMLMTKEEELLTRLVKKAEARIKDEIVEVS